MASVSSYEDRVFERRYNEMKVFSAALEQYQKANKKALLAMQEISGALERLTACISDLGKGSEIADDAKKVLSAAYGDVTTFKMGDGYLHLSSALSDKVKRYAVSLGEQAEQLKGMGKERKAAREEVDKYMRKREKNDKYQFRLQEAMRVLAAKERNYNNRFLAVNKNREDFAPTILQVTLEASHHFMSELTSTLGTVKDCISMFMNTRETPYPAGGHGVGNGGSEPIFSSEQIGARNGDQRVPLTATESNPPLMYNGASALRDSPRGSAAQSPSVTPAFTVPPPLYQYPPCVSTVRGTTESDLTGTRLQGIPLSDDDRFAAAPAPPYEWSSP